MANYGRMVDEQADARRCNLHVSDERAAGDLVSDGPVDDGRLPELCAPQYVPNWNMISIDDIYSGSASG